MKSYVFQVELAHEDDGRWSTWIDALPGCAAWGHTKEEALQAIQDAAEAYIEDMIEAGEAARDTLGHIVCSGLSPVGPLVWL